MTGPAQLGWIGLGQMGAPMAERLLAEGVTLHVHDPAPEAVASFVARGAVAHPSPRAVADAAGIVFACLPSREISQAVAFGPDGVAGGGRIRIHVEMSTIGKTCVETIAAELAKHGIRTVDGPISGGPPAAREGRLAMMTAGDPDACEEVTPWLARIGRTVVNLGDQPGNAQIMKLVNNLIMAANVVVAAEGLAMGAKAGLDPDTMVRVVASGTGSSRALTDIIAPAALPGTFDFGAHLSIVEKDVVLGVAEADALDVPVPVIEAAKAIWRQAAAEGYAREDFTRIVQLVEKRSGTEIRSRNPGSTQTAG